ncbi:6-pyruvoyl tetrahydrobiopterin synthase [Holothuria leucospilota]|uniref:6-pyruvoyltetrahydropterin synthase n=1 Tax=Holothuria leucospilota TaxID=206669 RepID=A0A9Q1BNJ1_HOLLE|nr:6-pyruvoyl tetrahydrobiopterin synthase [Holothuria leucospilota]
MAATDSKLPIVTITRIQCFSAAHRLHSPHLSDEENKTIYGKCNHPNGHGHNYRAEVTLKGPVDPKTGMLCNIADLKVWIEEAIMKPMDHKHIDKDVEWFYTNPSTMENIAIFIWHQLKAVMTEPQLLHAVKLWETDNHFAIYKGES